MSVPTIYDRFREFKPFTKHDGTYGIEIETETKKPYPISEFFYWNAVKDGSLRDYGVEYVLKSPLPFEKTAVALKEFGDKTVDLKFIPDSNSTSVHVHVNMLNEVFMTLANIFTTYALIENLLIRLSGPSRKSNLFCLPICDAEQTYKDMISMLEAVSRNRVSNIWTQYSEEGNKYAALNLASLGRIGSVEFRSFRGDPSIKAISEWVLVIHNVLSYCRQEGLTPPKIIEQYRDNQTKFLKSVFGVTKEAVDKAVTDAGDKVPELLNRNFWYAASIAYSVKDWGSLDKLPEKVKYKNMKALDAFCVASYSKVYDKLTPDMQAQARIIFRQNGGVLQEVQINPGVGDVWNHFQPAQAGLQAAAAPFNGILNIVHDELNNFEDQEPMWEDG